ncbi:MAG: SRPBCC family protein [Pseudomonadota bacterium]
MSQTKVSRVIDAPIVSVFKVIADCSQYAIAVPHILETEILSDTKSGVGTRFRETRDMNGRQATTEIEISELEENRLIRFMSDSGGTTWDSLYTFSEEQGQTSMTLVMEARPYKLLARLFNPLIKGMVQKALESDMDAVKQYCEQDHRAPDSE